MCPFCGTAINPGAIVCIGCGATAKFNGKAWGLVKAAVLGFTGFIMSSSFFVFLVDVLRKKESIESLYIFGPFSLFGFYVLYRAWNCYNKRGSYTWYKRMQH